MPSSRSGQRLVIHGSRLGLHRLSRSSAEMPTHIFDKRRLGLTNPWRSRDQFPGTAVDGRDLVGPGALPAHLPDLAGEVVARPDRDLDEWCAVAAGFEERGVLLAR